MRKLDCLFWIAPVACLATCSCDARASHAAVATLVSSAIVGGEPAAEDAYPWFASIFVAYEGEHYPLGCGGTLLDATHVITAAHCTLDSELDEALHQVVKKPTSPEGMFVAIRPQSLDAVSRDELIAVTQLWVAPGYTDDLTQVLGDAAAADLTILELERCVELDAYPALASASEVAELIDRAARVRTIGHGLTDPEGRSLSDALNQVDVSVVSNEVCGDQYAGIAPITAAMLCAGSSEGGRDSCSGDSGGPIFYEGRSNAPTLLGVVSWGTEVIHDDDVVACGSPDYASVYTNVAYFREYISNCLAADCATMSPKRNCIDGYTDADGLSDNGCEHALRTASSAP